MRIEPVRVTTEGGNFRQTVAIGRHRLVADEPVALGGDDAGPAPHEWVLAGLGACTSMTLKLYAARKQWPLEKVDVLLTAEHTPEGFVITREVRTEGPLTDEQRSRLLEIAKKCPVHKTLSNPIHIGDRIPPAK